MHPGKIAIIGGGIAGLCTAVYARKCGYEVDVFEMNATPGGLATSWRRDGYTFETCLHWLLGSHPDGLLHSQWQEVFDIEKLTFLNPSEYVRLETEHGESLSINTNVDRMEEELLRYAPQDAGEIRHLASSVRKLARFNLPDLSESWPRNWFTALRSLPYLPLLREWSSISCNEYSRRFTHPLLKRLFASGESSELSAIAFVLSLAWMGVRNAGYPIGGAQAVIRPIADHLLQLGGRLRTDARVERILVENGVATGVQLASGETIAADWVISAADGHATIYELLGGRYTDKATDKIYGTLKTFPSYLQVSLGVARDLSGQPGFVSRILDIPLTVNPGTELSQVSFRFFHFDPTFAPPGKTAVTCFLPTYNFRFWVDLQQHDPVRYQAEKDRIAEAVIAILEKSVPDLRQAIEVIDVSTPATVIRYTGNWKGSMEGWLMTPGTGFKRLPCSLPGLQQFLMVGQWVMPGGGLPSGLMTARAAIQETCKHDKIPFLPRPAFSEHPKAA
ncbi:MAG TPA: NAD(P)/FAD-dependent oxidoreductase [Bryobacteraceae bacterium]|nr:NAD(P)/FAD-dependent oxidoreductase [Bryobacteraceae bacterium]